MCHYYELHDTKKIAAALVNFETPSRRTVLGPAVQYMFLQKTKLLVTNINHWQLKSKFDATFATLCLVTV